MLTIYTNESNPNALKLIIASKYAKKDIRINIVNSEVTLPEPRRLPYVEQEKGRGFFVPNAGLLYILPTPENSTAKVNEWLEWESLFLVPILTHFGNVMKGKSKDNLLTCFKKLNDNLGTNTYLIDGILTACDISLWSLLFPLIKDANLNKEYLGGYQNIQRWFQSLENEKNFQESVNKYLVNPGNVSYQALQAGAKYFPESLTEASPQHVVEVTAEELEAAKNSWNKLPIMIKNHKKGTVLPTPGGKNILITSALPYVNNVPHLGNIIGCVLSSDVFARFSRLCNNNTLFICGTDEYGTATETKALEEGMTCQAICDKYFKIHSEIYEWFNISFDYFGRTSTPEQTELCQELFLQMNHNGFMFTETVEQLHCEKCNRYLADRFVEGGCPNIGCNYEDARGDQCDGCGKLVNAVELKNPRCKVCTNTPKLKYSNQFFLDLPKLEPLLLHWIKKSSPGWSHNAEVIGKAWLKEGLKPRCITRDLKWGVPVPLDGFRDKVFYVWFDAPIGYMSITKGYTKDWEKWWKPDQNTEVSLVQFMAKDNVPFHAIMFPATMLGVNKGYVTVSNIMATEYLNYEDGKFSKSRGVGVFGTDAQDTEIPSDVWRFYLLYVRPESQDSSFSWVDLATKNNSELLNNLGNFINRALVFAKNNFNKTIPKMDLLIEDYTLLALCTREFKHYVACLEKAKLRDGIRSILAISKHGNQYMQSNQPWVLLKGSDEEKLRAGTVIGVCCNLSALLSVLLHPYMPDTSDVLKKQLNAKDFQIDATSIEIIKLLPEGHLIGEPSPLFSKIEPTRIEELKAAFAGKQNEVEEAKNKNNKKFDSINTGDVKNIEEEVAKQAALVRSLKESGKEKSVWQPEVTKLLALKTQLQNAQQSEKVDPKALEDEVAKQATVVRELKEGGSEKSIWQPEVEKLLALKAKLAAASGGDAPAAVKKGKKGKK